MLRKRLYKNLGITAALLAILLICLCTGCEPLQESFDEAPLEGEGKTADGLPEASETEMIDEPASQISAPPVIFDDPSRAYLDLEKHEILSEYGEPEDTGHFQGGQYLSYSRKAGLIFFFPAFDFEDDRALISSVFMERGKIMGVAIGEDTFAEIISAWGKPQSRGFNSESGMQFLYYSFPDKEDLSRSIAIYFNAETETDPVYYAHIKIE